MGRQQSLRSRAAFFVSDLATGLLNPISDKPPSKASPTRSQSHSSEDASESKEQLEAFSDEDSYTVHGPDTSSFAAFLYSLLSSAESGKNSNLDEKEDMQIEAGDSQMNGSTRETGVKRSLFSRGKQSLSRAISHAARISGLRSQDGKSGSEINEDANDAKFAAVEISQNAKAEEEPSPVVGLPDVSEPSLLLSEKTRSALYASLPALVQGRKWILLYSTWRHGISLSTLYRRSMLWSGLSLLVVGDRKGAVFGGLVEAPLKPTNRKKYQGTNSTFVFTNKLGQLVIYRPTGVNRYFTLCSTDFLAIGGGSHFALYLDGDLLSGSSSVSETYGNPCLANSEDFEVKDVELWGFVYGSKYEEILALSQKEAPGICRW